MRIHTANGAAVLGLSLALSCLASGGGAQAADIPGNTSTRAILPIPADGVRGDWEIVGDSDWYRVRLTKGEAYAFRLNPVALGAQFLLRDSLGKKLKEGHGPVETGIGLEFVAPRTATYFVDVKATNFADPEDGPYFLTARADCPGDARTQCRLTLGRPQERAILFTADVDWFRVTLEAGTTYRFEATDLGNTIYGFELALLDRRGRVVADGASDDGMTWRIPTFEAPADGTYFVRLRNTEYEGDGFYSVVADRR